MTKLGQMLIDERQQYGRNLLEETAKTLIKNLSSVGIPMETILQCTSFMSEGQTSNPTAMPKA